MRLRPGPLANFSGGAGYMPFIVFLSVPSSLVFALISWILLGLKGRRSQPVSSEGGAGPAPVPLHVFARYARIHLRVCFVLAAGLGLGFFIMGNRMVYGDEWRYGLATVVLAAGPVVAAFLSTVVLAQLILKRGARGTNLVYALLVYLGLLLAGAPVFYFI